MDLLSQRIEEASLNAVTALEQVLYDGWVVRATRRLTKRRNSVNPLYPSNLDVHEKIRACEAFYEARHLPTVFRLTPMASPANLDAVLAGRGYQPGPDRVSVQHAALSAANASPPAAAATVVRQKLDEWLPIHDEIGHVPPEHQALHRELLFRIPGQSYFATIYDSIRPAACVLAVREGDLVGIYEMVTEPDMRRRGHGAALLQTVLHWAYGHGARTAYLQVMESNAPAVALYAKLGFRPLYTYWYRIKG